MFSKMLDHLKMYAELITIMKGELRSYISDYIQDRMISILPRQYRLVGRQNWAKGQTCNLHGHKIYTPSSMNSRQRCFYRTQMRVMGLMGVTLRLQVYT